MARLLTIGEVARMAGLRPSAIRYYEKAGVLPKPLRGSGQRRYEESIVGRLAVLERAKSCGFTLAEARALFDDSGPPSERWQRIARRKIAEFDALIARIGKMRDLLEQRCSCSDLAECGRRLRGR